MKNEFFTIDFTAKTLDLNEAYPRLKSPRLCSLWAKLVLASATAGVKVKGRAVLANAFIVDDEFLGDFTNDELKKLEQFELIKVGKINPKNVKPKLVSASRKAYAPPAVVDDGFLTGQNKAFDEFWSKYPFRGGMKLKKAEAKAEFARVITSENFPSLMDTLARYSQSSQVHSGFSKDAVNWLKEWEAWIPFDPSTDSRSRVRTNQARINRAEDDKVII